jgi:hypothetical protein
MNQIKIQAFNEIFLSDISKFDSRNYAYETFFNCEQSRFSKIAREYGKQNGSGPLNYMLNTFYSWKNKSVRPNSSSTYNIIASTAATFTVEEQFIEAYTQLAKFIKHSFPKKIGLNDINATFETIIERLRKFHLVSTSYYAKYIYKGNELQTFQNYVILIFEYYSKIIFENLNKDIHLIKKLHIDTNTYFLETNFSTYLYNIEIDIQEIAEKKFEIKKVFELNHTISIDELLSNEMLDFSLEKISEISKAKSVTEIDAFLTEIEIDKIVNKKREIEVLKKGGTIQYQLKTNSGLLKIKLRILSPMEKALIMIRLIFFIFGVLGLIYYCFILTKSYFIFIGGIILISFLITPIWTDIINFFKDILKPKRNGRK